MWVDVNKDMLDGTDWQYPNAAKSAQGADAPLTRVRSGGGRATVRTNRTMTFGVADFLGRTTRGSVPAGAVLEGRDSNGNGIPDVLEDAMRRGMVKFPKKTK